VFFQTCAIKAADFAALIAFVGMPSAATALTKPEFAAPTASAPQQFRVKDAVRIARRIAHVCIVKSLEGQPAAPGAEAQRSETKRADCDPNSVI
jgi:hypothetical protein